MISIFGINTITAQGVNFNYAKQIGNTGADVGKSVVTDSNGNLYTTGYFNGVGDFDPGAGTFTLSSYGLEDVFVTKFDAAGNFVWAKQIGGTGDERAYSISLDGSGNIYIAGDFVGTADFDPSGSTFPMTSMGGAQQDPFFLKLDPSGNFVWAKQIGNNNADRAYSIKVDGSGNSYSTGFFSGLVDFDPGIPTFTMTTTLSATQSYILKLDASGNFVWAKTFNGINSNFGNAITIDGSGNVYTTGFFSGSVDFDPNAPTTTLTASGGNDVFVSKLDNSGNYIWAKSFSGTSGEEGNSIVVDGLGNVYTTGFFQSTVDFDPNAGNYPLTANNRHVFISKLNSAGNFVWAKQIGGVSTNDVAYSIALDAMSNVYVAGSFNGNVDFDPGVSTFTINSVTADNDIFISKLDAAGNFLWAKAMQGIMDDKAFAVTLDNSGNVYSTGSFNSTVDFDPNPGTYTLTNPSMSGISDIFISKLSCQAPTVSIASSSSIMCVGESATLTASGASSYTWNTTSTVTSIQVSPTVTTSYSVTGLDVHGCVNTSTFSQVVSPCTGIIEFNKEALISIFPNPTNGLVFLNLKNDITNAQFILYNSVGQVVTSYEITNSTTKLNLETITKGIYFFSVIDKTSKVYNGKIIIQ